MPQSPATHWFPCVSKLRPAKVVPKAERPPAGSTFVDIGYAFDQEQATQRLTDLNLDFLDEGPPEPNESVPAGQIERIKRRLPLPPGAQGVIVDSGRSVHFIITGDPVGERVLEFTRGEESSFDKARPFVWRYLGPEPQADNDTRA